MRNWLKVLAVAAVAATICLTPSSKVRADDDVYFTLYNNTQNYYLTLYVDGVSACATPPGDHCTTLVSQGWHTFRITSPQGADLTRRIEVGPNGGSWTITENPPSQ